MKYNFYNINFNLSANWNDKKNSLNSMKNVIFTI